MNKIILDLKLNEVASSKDNPLTGINEAYQGNVYLRQACVVITTLSIIVSLVFIFYNQYVTKFLGNQYLPEGSLSLCLILGLMYSGSALQFGRNNYLSKVIIQISVVIFIFALTILLTTGVQYSPFPPIDPTLVKIDSYLGFHIPSLLETVARFPGFKPLLMEAYFSLKFNVLCVPLLLILLQKNKAFDEYCFLFLATAFIGFVFYYFFPSLAPASQFSSPYFFQEQYATAIKFYQIHLYATPTTLEGGLIAFPSFHVIWALIGQYTSRSIPWLYYLLLPFTFLLILACPLLGWHYVTDIIGSFFILLCAIFILKKLLKAKKTLQIL